MKLFSSIAVVIFSLGMFAGQLPATAAHRSAASPATALHAKKPKATLAVLRENVKASFAKTKKLRFLGRIADRKVLTPKQPLVRLRNEGIPLSASINVPRPVVGESSYF